MKLTLKSVGLALLKGIGVVMIAPWLGGVLEGLLEQLKWTAFSGAPSLGLIIAAGASVLAMDWLVDSLM